jgi:lysophospholipase
MSRLAALPFGLLLFLSGCGGPDTRQPFTDSRIPPGLETRFYPPEGWTWGLVKVGKAPPARYGVSSGAGPVRGHVLILPDYGEPSEVWFETARELNARGLTVWTLEAVGQGGSGRHLRKDRDLGHATAFAPDVAAVQVMAAQVIRGRPLTLVAGGSAAPVALSALEGGMSADALVLESPRLDAQGDPRRARWLTRAGLGALRAPGARWRREAPDDARLGLTADPHRGRLRLAWQTANPDLRMGGPSFAWIAAFDDAARESRAGTARIRTRVLITAPAPLAGLAAPLCRPIRDCQVQGFPGGSAQHLERDAIRRPWLDVVASAAGQP